MSRPHTSIPHTDQESNMYDDASPRQGAAEHYQRRSPLQNRDESWKDQPRKPHRGQVADRMNAPGLTDRDQWQQHDNGSTRHQDRHQDEQAWGRGEGRGQYNDRDREGYRSPRRERSRSRHRSRDRSPYFGGAPNRTLILEGIPIKMTQEDIFDKLQNSFRVNNLEEVRLIKDKKTGMSRQFAFAQFAALEDARAFLDRYFPSIQLYGAYDATRSRDAAAAAVRISYSREKEDRDRAGSREDDWKCDICYLVNYSHRTACFRCSTPRTRNIASGVGVAMQPKMSTFSGFATTGDSDVSPDNSASQFLLFRGLEPGVTEELLAKGVMKLHKVPASIPQTDKSIKKLKMASTSSDATLGAKEGSLRRILLVRDRKNNESWRYGFAEFSTVQDAQAAMAKYKASEKFTISSKPVLISYVHAGVFVPVLHAPSKDLEKFTFSPILNPSVKLMYWDEAGYVSELITTRDERSALEKARESVSAKLAAAVVPTGKDGEAKSKKRKIEKEVSSTSKKAVAPHLQFWSNRHAELHGLPTKDNVEPEDTSTGKDSQPEKREVDVEPPQSFADMDRKCCLLCSRQFKTEDEVIKHERISERHRENMLNEDLKKKALAKLAKSKGVQTEAEGSIYRDRAKERRQAFNQPKQPAAQHNKAPKEASASTQPVVEDVTPAPSKGAALLGKMGWTAGEGLGAQGTGIKEAITTEIYTQGVGLGAEGGKRGNALEEADRSTRGSYADFVTKSKEKAKERFEGMN